MGQGTESCGGYEVEYNPYEDGLADGVWTQSNGAPIKISNMSLRHLKNARIVATNMRDSMTFSCDDDMWQGWVDAFDSEIFFRERQTKQKSKISGKLIKPTRGSKLYLVCHCGKNYHARVADLKRGWGKSCCKRCAAIKRDFGRPDPVCAKTGISLTKILGQLS